jgi:hypothetical protein
MKLETVAISTLLVSSFMVNPGVTYAQGNSHSNPDGDTKLANSNTTGVDKPYSADNQSANSQPASNNKVSDGNNGCGQDKKSGEPRDGGTHNGYDDNNGWCGGKNRDTVVYVIGATPAPAAASTSSNNVSTSNNASNASSTSAPEEKVLGASSLAFTGDLTDTILWLSVISGAVLVGLGLLYKIRKSLGVKRS